MNGAPREAGTAGAGPSGEDLDVVMTRFQEWTKTSRLDPLSVYGSGARKSAAAQPAIGKPGEAREVSYEQALRASSYRRPADFAAPLPPLPEKRKESEALKDRTTAAKEKTASARPQATAQAGPPPAVSAAAEPWPKASFAKEASANVLKSAPPKAAGVSPAQPPSAAQTKAQTAPPLSARSASKRRAGRSPLAAQLEKTAPVAVSAASPRKASSAIASVAATARPQPAFRDVLKGTPSLVGANRDGPAALEKARPAVLTLRVSDVEQARIQACAAQANLSVSAYLRQCALGVDDLRSQVEAALAKLREQPARATAEPEPGLAAIPTILRRFAKKLFRRPRKGAAISTSLVAP